MCNQRIVEHLSLAKKLGNAAYRHSAPYILFDEDDLVQISAIGLISADRDYNGNKNASFRTYSFNKIKWAIADARREEFGRTTARPQFDSLDEPLSNNLEGTREVDMLVDEDLLSPEDSLYQKELSGNIYQALQFLTEKERQTVISVFYKGMSQTDAATARGVTEGAVSLSLKSAKNKLRKILTKRTQHAPNGRAYQE